VANLVRMGSGLAIHVSAEGWYKAKACAHTQRSNRAVDKETKSTIILGLGARAREQANDGAPACGCSNAKPKSVDAGAGMKEASSKSICIAIQQEQIIFTNFGALGCNAHGEGRCGLLALASKPPRISDERFGNTKSAKTAQQSRLPQYVHK
jgi:hypothetical protein